MDLVSTEDWTTDAAASSAYQLPEVHAPGAAAPVASAQGALADTEIGFTVASPHGQGIFDFLDLFVPCSVPPPPPHLEPVPVPPPPHVEPAPPVLVVEREQNKSMNHDGECTTPRVGVSAEGRSLTLHDGTVVYLPESMLGLPIKEFRRQFANHNRTAGDSDKKMADREHRRFQLRKSCKKGRMQQRAQIERARRLVPMTMDHLAKLLHSTGSPALQSEASWILQQMQEFLERNFLEDEAISELV
jgi:hypothetical protein